MAIPSDPFAPPGVLQAGAGPFAPLTGALGENADRTREGLAKLLKSQRGSQPSLDTASAGLPMTSLGMPALGGSPVSMFGASAQPARSPSLASVASLFAPSGGEGGSGNPSFSPDFSLQGLQSLQQSLNSPFGIANNFGRAMSLFAGPLSPLLSLGKMAMRADVNAKVQTALQNLARVLDEEREQNASGVPGIAGLEGIAGTGVGNPATMSAAQAQAATEGLGGFGMGTGSPTAVDTSPNAGVAPDVGQTTGGGQTSGGGGGDVMRSGGTVADRSRAPGGAEPITAHQGEEIINPRAAQMFRPLLKQINAAVPPSGLRRLL